MKQSRAEILALNPVFTKFILNWQLSLKPEPFAAGDRVDSDSYNLEGDEEGTAILTQEMAEKLTIEQNEAFEQKTDKNPFSAPIDLNLIDSRLIISSKENAEAYLNDFASALEQIRIELNESDLLVLGVDSTPWLYQKNNYKPVKKALDYLKGIVDADFNGGFLLKEGSLLAFIPHLFWLIRCNASLPLFFMSFPNAKTVISICKYGVVHFDFYDKEESVKILRLLSKYDFREVDSCGDPVAFDNFDGRRLW